MRGDNGIPAFQFFRLYSTSSTNTWRRRGWCFQFFRLYSEGHMEPDCQGHHVAFNSLDCIQIVKTLVEIISLLLAFNSLDCIPTAFLIAEITTSSISFNSLDCIPELLRLLVMSYYASNFQFFRLYSKIEKEAGTRARSMRFQFFRLYSSWQHVWPRQRQLSFNSLDCILKILRERYEYAKKHFQFFRLYSDKDKAREIDECLSVLSIL